MFQKVTAMRGRDRTEFGDWLQGQMDERGWTMTDLAHRMDKSTAIVANWLYRHVPRDDNCDALAEALGVPVETVIERTYGGLSEAQVLRRRLHRAVDRMSEQDLRDTMTWLRRRS